MRRSTVEELARERRVTVPPHLAFHAGMGLAAALEKFAFTLSLLQEPEVVRRVASEMCEDALVEGVTTLEIRFAPQLHRGAPIEVIIDAAVDGAAGRAGIILCGLYGEPPDMIDRFVSASKSHRAVVGIDLAGGPRPGASFGLVDYERPFRRAGELGLGRTVHAGEGRPPNEIRVCIEHLGVDRIGHGTTLLDDERIVELVIDRGVTVEACLTSNVHTGAISCVEDHPLARWLARGVRACICTDNTLFSSVTAPEEHHRAALLPGMTDALLRAAVAHGHAAAFRRQ